MMGGCWGHGLEGLEFMAWIMFKLCGLLVFKLVKRLLNRETCVYMYRVNVCVMFGSWLGD